MTRLKDYLNDDQLYYTEMFVDECKRAFDKFDKKEEEKKTINPESFMFNQLLRK